MNAIAHIRQEILKVPQSVLADITGTTQATVSRWENGELHPDIEQMAAIRRAAIDSGVSWDDRWFFETPDVSE